MPRAGMDSVLTTHGARASVDRRCPEAREAVIHWVAEPGDAVTGSTENRALRRQLSLENIADCVEEPAVSAGHHELGPGSGRQGRQGDHRIPRPPATHLNP